MNTNEMKAIRQAVDADQPISEELALAVLESSASDLSGILNATETLRTRHFGRKAILCSIINAKSGNCSEDCTFCAQSTSCSGDFDSYELCSTDEILKQRRRIAEYPVSYYSIVTSGKSATDAEVDAICETLHNAEPSRVRWCCSLGCLGEMQLLKLRNAGMKRYHHNLEACESFFPNLCTSHTFHERLETNRAAKRVGMDVCCGGIFGVGEENRHRVELAMTIAKEQVDSIPLNFLVAIPDTPLAQLTPLTPHDILRITAMFRLTSPKAEVRICGGRAHLRRLQSMIYSAGACGMMVGDLLTTDGDQLDEDMRMLKDLGMEPVVDEG